MILFLASSHCPSIWASHRLSQRHQHHRMLAYLKRHGAKRPHRPYDLHASVKLSFDHASQNIHFTSFHHESPRWGLLDCIWLHSLRWTRCIMQRCFSAIVQKVQWRKPINEDAKHLHQLPMAFQETARILVIQQKMHKKTWWFDGHKNWIKWTKSPPSAPSQLLNG